MSTSAQKRNWSFIFGILILSLGVQFSNYGVSVCIAGDVLRLNASEHFALLTCLLGVGGLVVLPILGRLTQALGQRNALIIGILMLLIGRVIMITTGSWVIYSIGVVIQGLGSGLLVAAPLTLMATAVEPGARAQFFGYVAAANGLGNILGPQVASNLYALGGIMSKLALVSNIPVLLIGFFMMAKYTPNQRTTGQAGGFDFTGLTLSIISCLGLAFILNLGGKVFAWTSVVSIVLIVVTVLSWILLIRRSIIHPNPAVPFRMLKNPRMLYTFVCALVAAAYASSASSYGTMWIRLNYANLPGGSFFAGSSVMAQSIVMFILGLFLAGYIGKKFALRFRPWGIFSMVAAMLATALLYCMRFTGTAEAGDIIMLGGLPLGMLMLYCGTIFGGFTSGISMATYSAFWQSNTPKEEFPAGQGLYYFAQTGGAVVYSAVVGFIVGSSNDYSRAFLVAFVLAIIGTVCAYVGFRFSDEEVAAVNGAK